MGIFVSFLAFLAVVLLGIVGAEIPYVFGVILPYIAIFAFIIGVIIRVVKWGRAPVPFRITTTSGQAKSHDWIKQSKLDSPSTTLGVIGRMAMEVLFFRSLFKNTKAELKNGTKLVYGDEIWLWGMSLAFHWSFLIIVLRHFRFFSVQTPEFVTLIQNLDGMMQIGLPIIYMTNVLFIVGVTFLFLRRLFNSRVRYISLTSDYFPLLLILGIGVTGVLMRYFTKVDLIGIKDLVSGLLAFSPPAQIADISAMFWVHFTLVCTLLIYFPMSKLVHMAGIFMSPTRNLANNNRMKRHVNPWAADLKMETHSYEEYEDEFRPLMKAAGLPLDKEDKDGK